MNSGARPLYGNFPKVQEQMAAIFSSKSQKRRKFLELFQAARGIRCYLKYSYPRKLRLAAAETLLRIHATAWNASRCCLDISPATECVLVCENVDRDNTSSWKLAKLLSHQINREAGGGQAIVK